METEPPEREVADPARLAQQIGEGRVVAGINLAIAHAHDDERVDAPWAVQQMLDGELRLVIGPLGIVDDEEPRLVAGRGRQPGGNGVQSAVVIRVVAARTMIAEVVVDLAPPARQDLSEVGRAAPEFRLVPCGQGSGEMRLQQLRERAER